MASADKKSCQNIRVYARPRPLSKAEVEAKSSNIVQSITLHEIVIKSGYNEKKYCFDHVFQEDALQATVFNVVVAPLINSIIAGFNCTVFAYGQSGTGKDYTIFGENLAVGTDFKTDSSIGLVLRTSEHLFAELSKLSLKTEYTVRVSFIEIFNEEVRDLFSESVPLRIYDDPLNKGSVCMKELTKVTVFNTRDVNDWLNIGVGERQAAMANANNQSTRSHALFTFVINIRKVTSKGEEVIKSGRLHLIALAGSEHGRVDVRIREAGTLNRSLITVGKVIRALSQRMQHIPYRDSKLTRILQDSLGGNAKTSMIATFSPSSKSWDETVATLDLAQVARTVSNSPQVNVDRKQANLLKEMNDEVSKLREDLTAARAGEGFYVSTNGYEQMTQDLEAKNQKILGLLRKIRDMEEHARDQQFQYKKLCDSFEKTKLNSVRVSKELQKKQKVVKNGEEFLNVLAEKHDQLTNSAKLLHGHCEKATEVEEICHSKYQDKMMVNLDNAKASKEIAATAAGYLKHVKTASEMFVKKQNKHLRSAKKSCESTKYDYGESLGKLDAVLTEILITKENSRLEPEKVLKMGKVDYKERVEKFPKEFCDAMRKQPKKEADLVRDMDLSKEDFKERVKDLDLAKQGCRQEVNENLLQRDKFVKETEAHLLNLRNALLEQAAHLESQLKRDEARATDCQYEIADIDKEEQKLLDEAAALDKSKKLILRLIESNKKQNLSEQMKQNLSAFTKNVRDVVVDQNAASEDFNYTASAIHENLGNHIINNTHKMDNFIGGLVGTMRKNLVQHKKNLKTDLRECVKKVDDVKEDVLSVVETSGAIAKSMNQLSEIQNKYNCGVENAVQDSLETMEKLEKNISFAGHAGDTPAKNTFVYPKQIDIPKYPPLEFDNESEEEAAPENKPEESN